jgi:hypothetical protein
MAARKRMFWGFKQAAETDTVPIKLIQYAGSIGYIPVEDLQDFVTMY